ncbi:MAG: Tricorn protease-interacting factor F2 [Candidatus Heimdallarchaeota archaeon LC_2]|nr:MAG: Tricorn protease-interacting factor F2 [Candidatus Heimdallarchaeota archaeon LC_2]
MVDVIPNHYDIVLEPDLNSFKFNGIVKIDITTSEPVSSFTLHGNELEVLDCQILSNSKSEKATWNIDMENQEITIKFNEKLNSFNAELKFSGELNEKLAGFYRSKFSFNGEDHYAAVTQFEESDARRAFPCFDEPVKKATFTITLIIENHLVAISNSHIVEEINLDGNLKKVIFDKTPKMSTYLLFFGVGEFNKITRKTRDYTVSVMASKQHEPLNTFGDFSLDFAVKSLEYCEDYFAVKYPFTKLDNIATADFAHGAMENYGAILYRENLLLHFPGITNSRLEMIIQMVIAHEITHQWFGNLVSPINWKYLWLNESFATLFGYGIVDYYHPEKKVWEYFVESSTEIALNSDAMIETLPIERPGEGAVGMTVKNAKILYEKGGSVLRQIKNYLGDDNFRDGLRHYLKKFSYKNARSDDLWDSLEEVSGKPVSKLMESWVLQEGYPLITIEKRNNKLTLSQNRFTFVNKEFDSNWIVPVSMKYYFENKEPEIIFYLMENTTLNIDIPSDVIAYKANTELTGFYRVRYPSENLAKLSILGVEGKLTAIDKWNLETDLYALLRANKISMDDYLSFISSYVGETSRIIVSSISGHLHLLYDLGKEDTKNKISAVGKEFLEKTLDVIGFEAKDGEDTNISTLRGDLLVNAVIFGSESVKNFAMDKFQIFKEGGKVSADILSAVCQISARETNDLEWFINRFENAENEQMSVTLLFSLGKFTQISHIEKMQNYIFEKVPMRNQTTLIQSLASNPEATSSLWHWYLANLDNFEKLHEYMYQISILAIVTKSSQYESDVKEFYEGYLQKNPKVKDAVDVALEGLKIRNNLTSHINL